MRRLRRWWLRHVGTPVVCTAGEHRSEPFDRDRECPELRHAKEAHVTIVSEEEHQR